MYGGDESLGRGDPVCADDDGISWQQRCEASMYRSWEGEGPQREREGWGACGLQASAGSRSDPGGARALLPERGRGWGNGGVVLATGRRPAWRAEGSQGKRETAARMQGGQGWHASGGEPLPNGSNVKRGEGNWAGGPGGTADDGLGPGGKERTMVSNEARPDLRTEPPPLAVKLPPSTAIRAARALSTTLAPSQHTGNYLAIIHFTRQVPCFPHRDRP